MSDVDDQIARARAAMERISADNRGGGPRSDGSSRARRRQVQDLGRRLTRIMIAVAVILAVTTVVGLVVGGIGIMGALAMIVAIVAAILFFGARPTERPVSFERLAQSDVKALPAQTERWLVAQRPQLPAPAVQLVDRIGQRLDMLSPQLARVENDAPEAQEVRKLVGEQLPAFVADYARVPPALRGQERNGRTPDMELVDGLKLIEQEIGDMTQRLAAADLDQLQTRGRFLELKYKDEGGS
jgi:hypothetical protein